MKKDKLDNLQNITLIIPTFNRAQFLARLINYYAAKKTALHFLILDSSESPARELNEATCRQLGEQGVYINFPSTIAVAEKLLEGLQRVVTPFCAFCADDDLVFIEGLAEALAFLQENLDYVCTDGIYLNFNQIDDKVHLGLEYARKGIDAAEPGARVFRLYQNYESLFYGVFRTKQAQAIFSGVSKNPSLHYQELFQATSALLIGKSKRLAGFYAARQSCQPADQGREKWQTYYWFAEDPKEFLEHYQIYRQQLWSFYQSTVSGPLCSREEFFQIMDLAHAIYFSKGCPPAYFHAVLQAKWPQDSYQEFDLYHDNLCNQLKSGRRISQELLMEKIINWLPKKFASFYSKRDTKTLNASVQASTKMSWNCELNEQLRWLASAKMFRQAYHELCHYLSAALPPSPIREDK